MTTAAPSRREITAEEHALDYVEALHVEKHEANLRSGNPRDSLRDAISDEIDRILTLSDKTARRDGIEDTTLADLIAAAAKRYAAREREDGDLDGEVEEMLREERVGAND